MSRQKTSAAELRVGILVIAAVVILIIFILSVSGDIALFKKRITYRTRLAAADGLKPGDEVRLAGKSVGKVENVEFSQALPASPTTKSIIVTVTMDASEVRDRVRSDSVAVLGQQGFLGDRVIDISPGTVKGDPLTPGSEIPSADQASLSQVFAGASDVLVQFNAVGKQLQELMDNVNKGEGTIGKILHDDQLYVNLNRTVLEAQDLVKELHNGKGTIPQMIKDPRLYDDLRATTADLKGMIADLKAGKGSAGKLLTDDELYRNVNSAIEKATGTIGRLDRISADIEAGKGTVGKLIKDDKLHNDIQATVASLKEVSDNLNKGKGTAGKLLHDEALYNNVNNLSVEAVKMLYDFRQNPKKYLTIHLTIF